MTNFGWGVLTGFSIAMMVFAICLWIVGNESEEGRRRG